MAAPSNVFWDPEGHLHTNALHWEGFPRLLWESFQSFHYTDPPNMMLLSIWKKEFTELKSG
jgi:hypothetical protein